MPKPSSPSRHISATSAAHEIVDPAWLLKAATVVVAFALLCALALFWAVFYLTQWQYVLAPSRTVATTPYAAGLTFTEVHFGIDVTGQPQLDGWWIPADTTTSPTVLILHDGKGSMSDVLPNARLFHDANLNVLLFDYRGFGHSSGSHPTQALMQDDAQSALAYLRDARHIELSHVIVYGNGLGASLAVNLCGGHNDIPAIILDSPFGDTQPRIMHDARTRLIPVRLLFHEQFPLAEPAHTLATPKLVITYTTTPTALDLQQIGDPKMTVELSSPSDTTNFHKTLSRFLDSYAPTMSDNHSLMR